MDFDINELDSAMEGEMTVMVNGRPTDWTWKFAGPAHPKTIAQNNRVSREQLAKRRLQEQAQVNSKKWKAPEQTPDELLEDNVNFVCERLLGWSSVKLGGQDYPFSEENARALLRDRKKGALLQQAIEFILEDNSFTQRSDKTSQPSPSASSI
jgi:hypothetical protein